MLALSTELSNFYLSKSELKILKQIYNAHPHHGIPEGSPLAKTAEFKRLREFDFIIFCADPDIAPIVKTELGEIDGNCFCVNDAGEQYLRIHSVRNKTDRRYWITTAIALIALIKSFLPEISAAAAWLLKQLAQ